MTNVEDENSRRKGDINLRKYYYFEEFHRGKYLQASRSGIMCHIFSQSGF